MKNVSKEFEVDGYSGGGSDDSGTEDDLDDTSMNGNEEEEDDSDGDDGFDDQETKTEETESKKRKHPDQQNGGASKSAKIEDSKSSLYKPPTVDELSALHETQMLYHSNLFRMQMDELLLEVSMKDKHRRQLDQWLIKFSTYVQSLPKSSEYQLSSRKWMEKNVCDPLGKSIPETKGLFLFVPPTKMEFVGSFASGTATIQNATVDVMMTLPKECVHATDWQNGRWLVKRSRYLAWLAANIREKADVVADVNWTTHLGISTRPVLQVTPAEGVGKKWKVNLFPVPPPEAFKQSRFSPERNSLYMNWYYSEDETIGEEKPPSPCYNWSCAVDVMMQQHFDLIHKNISKHASLAKGIKLLKVWLAQRGLYKGVRCFSGHLMSMLIMHLLQTRKINPQMSAYQVYRTAVLTLSSSDWTVKGPNMCGTSADDDLSPEVLHELYEVVFVDPSGKLNIAANLLSVDFLWVKHEAKLALEILDSSSAESFESLFIMKVDFYQSCDQILSLKLTKKKVNEILQEKFLNHQALTMDGFGDVRSVCWSHIIKTVREGLGERVLVLKTFNPSSGTSVWSIQESPPKISWSLVVGLVIHPTSAMALLTKGPPADEPEVGGFKSFWGEKCSLRRFKDGSFHEAVLWGDPKVPTGERRLIPGKIATYLLKYHYKIKNKDIHYVANQFESLLHLNIQMTDFDFSYGTGEEATVCAIQAFDSLSRKLRSLDLPLKITSVQPSSDVSRHTRVFPPLARALFSVGKVVVGNHLTLDDEKDKKCPRFNNAMEVLVFLEMSGKWPDDVDAIQAIKTEFYCKMGELLEKDNLTSVVFPKYLLILWEGYYFYVRVCYRREIYLQRLVKAEDGDWKEQDTVAATNLEKQIEIIPRLTTALASVQADNPSFNSSVRLVKRWVSSQLLLSHIPQLAVELLVTHLYLHSAPYSPPHTAQATLLRFLHLLAFTDWKATPILVNLNGAFTVDDVAELSRRFTSQRATLPAMFIATPYDLRGLTSTGTTSELDYRFKLASVWTKKAPSLPIIYRSKQLAQAALKFIDTNILDVNMDIHTMFRPSLDAFDVVIRLQFKQLSRWEEHVDFNPVKQPVVHPYKQAPGEVMPIVMFDPAHLYLKELRAAYHHLALFFHDEHGGNVIGVVWKPQALSPDDVKVGSLEGHQLVGVKEVKQIANTEAIVDDFRTLGNGLVDTIVLKNK